MKLEDITAGQSLPGIEASQVVSVVATVPHGEGALQLIYRTPEGVIKERLLSRDDEASVAIATAERPFAFDGDGAAFQLACEAKRIDLAFLFDPMMALHTSSCGAWSPRPGPWSRRGRTASGTSYPRSFRTTPKCATPRAVSASSSSSRSIAMP